MEEYGDADGDEGLHPAMALRYHRPDEDWLQTSLGTTSKIPPMYDGRTSWFKYEELIDDWIDLTTMDEAKHGPALKNRLTGDAEVYKTLFDRNLLKTTDGVRHFKEVLRPHFVKGAQSVFLWRFLLLMRTNRAQTEFVKWIGKFTVMKKRLLECWMDLMPEHTKQSPNYIADVARQSAENLQKNPPEAVLDPDDDAVFDEWKTRIRQKHAAAFPLGENLISWVFIVASDLTEPQRERLTSTMTLKGIRIENYTFEAIKEVFLELFCAPRSSLDNPSLRASGQGSGPRSFVVLEDGTMDGAAGHWVQDDETGEEGFIGETDDTF